MAPPLGPRNVPKLFILSLLPVAGWFVLRPLLDPVPPLPALHASVGFALFAFSAALYLVPALGPTFIKANLKGRDLLKTDPTPV
jgi:UDP-N-acetylglucosamine--dolichyl-phosphate N-acetylglucosaminephosphotransferase